MDFEVVAAALDRRRLRRWSPSWPCRGRATQDAAARTLLATTTRDRAARATWCYLQRGQRARRSRRRGVPAGPDADPRHADRLRRRRHDAGRRSQTDRRRSEPARTSHRHHPEGEPRGAAVAAADLPDAAAPARASRWSRSRRRCGTEYVQMNRHAAQRSCSASSAARPTRGRDLDVDVEHRSRPQPRRRSGTARTTTPPGPITDDNILCGTGIPGDPLQDGVQYSPYRADQDPNSARRSTPLFPNGLPPRSPVFCRGVSGILGATNQTLPIRKAGGDGRYGRRDFLWQGGRQVAFNYQKRNVFGFGLDFAEDTTKTSWGIEFSWMANKLIPNNTRVRRPVAVRRAGALGLRRPPDVLQLPEPESQLLHEPADVPALPARLRGRPERLRRELRLRRRARSPATSRSRSSPATSRTASRRASRSCTRRGSRRAR